jgi:hypothetical protein
MMDYMKKNMGEINIPENKKLAEDDHNTASFG